MLNSEGDKSKGMHWPTFNRPHAEHNDFVNVSLADDTEVREWGWMACSMTTKSVLQNVKSQRRRECAGCQPSG